MSTDSVNHIAVREYLQGLQARIVQTLEQIDGGSFLRDPWSKAPDEPLQGNGLSCILEQGNVFERAGVLFSHVKGKALPPTATQRKPELTGRPFEAMGVSLVLHPRNPYVPTVHMNVRGLIALAQQPDQQDAWWFGGGMDLTPYYPFDEDAVHFHRVNRDALAPLGADLYPQFKRWCDEYFYLKHRKEARGIGGVFFDDYAQVNFEHSFGLIRAVGDAFLPAYTPIVHARKDISFGEQERQHQALRRGRYVEFNLVFDRGTLFGLQSGGRTESILASMPPVVQWQYNAQPTQGSPEARIYEIVRNPRDWV